ncbi:hypothetical protein KJ742_02130 [Patescibacteria group bacterium]|nr:hypothetical protein [Patescibacteria group bacterium]MBU1682722.1 hypothetical protein [Patescibacteria group bacterium]MBU1934882.1 hypothetical protein [Patescibacteria group bacterium]
MDIPKDHIPKFLIAIVVFIVIALAITNGKESFEVDFSFTLTPHEEILIDENEEETNEENAVTTPTTTTTTATEEPAPATVSSSACYPSLSGKKDTRYNGIILNWTTCSNEDFQFYKLVKSSLNSNPSYPSDPVILSSSNRSASSYIDQTVTRATTYYYKVCVVQRLNNVSCSNVVSVSY